MSWNVGVSGEVNSSDCNGGYRSLNPKRLVEAAEKIAGRVEGSFPKSGLSSLAEEVACVTRETVRGVVEISRPNWWLRSAVGVLVLLAVLGPLFFSVLLHFRETVSSLGDFLEATDAGLHMLLVLGAGIAFLVTLEGRLQRKRALSSIAEFRSLAHLVDMHQINKDPGIDDRPVPEGPDGRTVRSDAQLGVYLDYSSDLLSIIGKLAAYFGQHLQDRVVLDAVNEIENLSSGLAAKFWQKIMISRGMEPETGRKSEV